MKFSLGKCVATRGAHKLMAERDINPPHLLMRHVNGDWGELDESDKRRNDEALIDGSRLLSAYTFDDARIWVITEWDRSVTTFLLPHEY
jgi:hypothetical protein